MVKIGGTKLLFLSFFPSFPLSLSSLSSLSPIASFLSHLPPKHHFSRWPSTIGDHHHHPSPSPTFIHHLLRSPPPDPLRPPLTTPPREDDRLRRRRWSPGESPSFSRSSLQRFHLRSELELCDFHWIFRFLFDFSDCCRTIHCIYRASRRLMMLSSSTTSSIARSMSSTNEVGSLCDHAHFDYWFFNFLFYFEI